MIHYVKMENYSIIFVGDLLMTKKIFQKIDKILLGSFAMLFFLVFNLMDNIFGTNIEVKIWVVKIVILICFLILIIMYAIFSILRGETKEEELKVFKVNFNKKIEMLYLKPSNKLSLNDIVSVYVDENGIEKLVGLGYVFVIQEKNKLIQIDMISQKSDEQLLELCKNYENIIVKKEINYKSFNELVNIARGDE